MSVWTAPMHKLFFDAALTPAGWQDDVVVEIEAGTVIGVEVGVQSNERAGAEPVGGIAVPGVANLHSHTFQRGFAGLTERRGPGADHFWTWRDAMYRFSAKLGPEEVEAIAALAFAEMLESGFTSVAEFHYLHHRPDGAPYDDPAELAQRMSAAAAQTGMGIVLLPVFYAHGGFDGAAPSPGQRRFVSSLDLYARVVDSAAAGVRGLPFGRVGIAPHSLRAVTGEELAALLESFPERPVHIHVAEQIREVDECLAATGARPVEWLLDHAPVDPRWCLVHATHMTAGETLRLAGTGAAVGLCPMTESNLGDGIFPATDYDKAGGRYGVGSDSNVLISLTHELRTLEYGQRLRDRARNRLAQPGGSVGRHLFDAVAQGGARALGTSAPQIAAGSRADLVVLDASHPALFGRRGDDILDSWIFAAAGSTVRTVYASGKPVVRDGRHVAREEIEAAFRRAVGRILDL